MKNYNNYLYEYLNKESSQLFKYLNASQDDKYINLSFNFPYLLQDFIDTIEPSDYDIDKLLEQYDKDDDFFELIYDLDDYDTNAKHKEFLINFGEYCYDNINNWSELTANMVFHNPEKTKIQWLLYEAKDIYEANHIYLEGFEYGEENFDELHIRDNKSFETEDGYNIGYNVWDFNRYGLEYIGYSYELKHGKELLMFKSSGIHVYDNVYDEEITIFSNKDPYDIILLKKDNDKYYIESRLTGNSIVNKDSYEELIKWVVNNFDQYRKHLVSDTFDKLKAKRKKRKIKEKANKFNL